MIFHNMEDCHAIVGPCLRRDDMARNDNLLCHCERPRSNLPFYSSTLFLNALSIAGKLLLTKALAMLPGTNNPNPTSMR